MKNLKKLLAMATISAMIFALGACSGTTTETGDSEGGGTEAGAANPVHECSYEDMIQASGIDVAAPDNATDVVYSYIENGDTTMSQVVFKLDGREFCYRGESTQLTAYPGLGGDSDEDVKDSAGEVNFEAAIEEATKLSGMYFEWESVGGTNMEKNECMAVYGLNDGKEGFISWLDVVPGVIYSLSVDQGASQELLENTANLVFIPMQGNA